MFSKNSPDDSSTPSCSSKANLFMIDNLLRCPSIEPNSPSTGLFDHISPIPARKSLGTDSGISMSETTQLSCNEVFKDNDFSLNLASPDFDGPRMGRDECPVIGYHLQQNRSSTPLTILDQDHCEPESTNQLIRKPTDFMPRQRKKKSRTRFTPGQVSSLEAVYQLQCYLAADERKQLAKHLELTDQQIKTWFQNRRMKDKRMSGSCQHPVTPLHLVMSTIHTPAPPIPGLNASTPPIPGLNASAPPIPGLNAPAPPIPGLNAPATHLPGSQSSSTHIPEPRGPEPQMSAIRVPGTCLAGPRMLGPQFSGPRFSEPLVNDSRVPGAHMLGLHEAEHHVPIYHVPRPHVPGLHFPGPRIPAQHVTVRNVSSFGINMPRMQQQDSVIMRAASLQETRMPEMCSPYNQPRNEIACIHPTACHVSGISRYKAHKRKSRAAGKTVTKTQPSGICLSAPAKIENDAPIAESSDQYLPGRETNHVFSHSNTPAIVIQPTYSPEHPIPGCVISPGPMTSLSQNQHVMTSCRLMQPDSMIDEGTRSVEDISGLPDFKTLQMYLKTQ